MPMQIPVGKKDVATVDDEDYPRLSNYKWHNSSGYALGFVNGKKQLMHRLIMNAPRGLVVDHIDHCRLNNVKSNLRIATMTENNQNRLRLVPYRSWNGYKEQIDALGATDAARAAALGVSMEVFAFYASGRIPSNLVYLAANPVMLIDALKAERRGTLIIDKARREAILQEIRLPLTPKEYGVLDTLAHRPGHAVPASHLVAHVCGRSLPLAKRSMRVELTISRLRRKLRKYGCRTIQIESVGRSYRLMTTEVISPQLDLAPLHANLGDYLEYHS